MKKKSFLASVASAALLVSAVIIPTAWAANPDVNAGLRTPSDTQLSGIPLSGGSETGSVGLSNSNGLFVDSIFGDMTDYAKQGMSSEWLNQDLVNALGINVDSDTIKNVTDYKVPGTLELSQSAASPCSSNLKAVYTLDTTLIKQVLNTWLLTTASSENAGTPQESWNTPDNSWWTNATTQTDPELVYVFTLPAGLSAESISTVVDGLSGFGATSSLDGQKLTVTVRESSIDTGSVLDLYKKINALQNITLTVDNITTDSSVVGQDLNISASAYGEFDMVGTSPNLDAPKHPFWSMGANPNPVVATVHVNAPSTVTFMNNDSSYAQTNVITGCSINNDTLTDQSMPENPSASAEKMFKGWNTSADGTGEWFTGDTIVNSNMTVYAIFEDAQTPVTPTSSTTTPTSTTVSTQASPSSKSLANTGSNITEILIFACLITSVGLALILRRKIQ